MSQIAEELAPRFHNNPPTLPERLASDYERLIEEVQTLAERANDAPKIVNDDIEQGVIGNLAKDVTKSHKNIEAQRVDEKEPFLRGGREVDGFFQPLIARLDKIADAMEKRGRDYLNRKAAIERAAREEEERRRRETERLAREEADRKLREAEAREREAREAREREERLRREAEERHTREIAALKDSAVREAAERDAEHRREAWVIEAERRCIEDERAAKAALEAAVAAEEAMMRAENERLEAERAAQAKPAEMARTRASGSLSTLATKPDFEILDFDAIDLETLRPYLPRPDVEKAIRSFIRVNKFSKLLRGVRIFEATTATFR